MPNVMAALPNIGGALCSTPQSLVYWTSSGMMGSSSIRYTTPHSTPLTLLAISASSLMNISPFPTKFQPSPKLATTISDSFVVSVLTLIPLQRAPLPPPSFTPNLITVILATTTYRSLRLPASNWFRTLSPVQLLKLLNPVTSLLSYALFTGSK